MFCELTLQENCHLVLENLASDHFYYAI